MGRVLQEQHGIAGLIPAGALPTLLNVAPQNTQPTLAARHYEYNALGHMDFSSVVAAGRAVMEYTTDAAGNVLTAIEQRRTPGVAGPQLYVALSTYDSFGRVLTSRRSIDPITTADLQNLLGPSQITPPVRYSITSTAYDNIGRDVTATWTDNAAAPVSVSAWAGNLCLGASR